MAGATRRERRRGRDAEKGVKMGIRVLVFPSRSLFGRMSGRSMIQHLINLPRSGYGANQKRKGMLNDMSIM